MLSFLRSLWSPVEVRRDMSHEADDVFAVIENPYSYPQWLVGAQRMRAVDDDFPAEGAAFHHSVGPTSDATVDDRTEVRAVDAPHRLELEVKVGPVRGVVELVVDQTTTGSAVRFRERPIGLATVLTPLARPLLAARNAESLRRLDALLDGA